MHSQQPSSYLIKIVMLKEIWILRSSEVELISERLWYLFLLTEVIVDPWYCLCPWHAVLSWRISKSMSLIYLMLVKFHMLLWRITHVHPLNDQRQSTVNQCRITCLHDINVASVSKSVEWTCNLQKRLTDTSFIATTF